MNMIAARVGLIALASLLTACVTATFGDVPGSAGSKVQAADYLVSVAAWRSERDDRLRAPDGWLSFTGSGQVSPGAQRVGSDPGNAIVVPGGPAAWGVLHLDADGTLRFDAEAGAGLTVHDETFNSVTLLTQLDEGGPTSIHAGDQRFYVVKTGDRYGWRFRDPASPALKAFAGVPHFPVDPAWRVEARWQAFAEPRSIELVTSNGTVEPARVPGQALFERDGRSFALLPVQENDGDDLFFIIADRTSGKDSYGGGRFLYASPPSGGRVVLDFNKAVNPPCALNGHVVCPLAPPENRLDVRIDAGETTYPLAK